MSVWLKNRKTNRYHYLNDPDEYFIKELVKLLDKDQEYLNFLEENFELNIAQNIADLIKTSVNNNQIFETKINDESTPVILQNSSTLPKDTYPLTMEKIMNLLQFCNFLSNCWKGVEIEK